MPRRPKSKATRVYRRDLKSHLFGFLLFDREGGFRSSTWGFNDEKEAEEELLKWNRVTGRDGHPVYAICVMPMYKLGKVPPRVMKRCFAKFLAQVQADRLELVAALERAKDLPGR